MNIENDIDKLENKIKKNSKKLEEYSLAKELIDDGKKDKKRYFVMWIITFVGLLISVGYNIYLLNDIGTVETTQEITDFDTINGNVINNGDNYGYDKANN